MSSKDFLFAPPTDEELARRVEARLESDTPAQQRLAQEAEGLASGGSAESEAAADVNQLAARWGLDAQLRPSQGGDSEDQSDVAQAQLLAGHADEVMSEEEAMAALAEVADVEAAVDRLTAVLDTVMSQNLELEDRMQAMISNMRLARQQQQLLQQGHDEEGTQRILDAVQAETDAQMQLNSSLMSSTQQAVAELLQQLSQAGISLDFQAGEDDEAEVQEGDAIDGGAATEQQDESPR